MKWFKHISDSHNDPDLCVAREKFGDIAIIIFWFTVEIYAKEFEHYRPGSDGFLKYSLKNFTKIIGKLPKVYTKCLDFLQKKDRIIYKVEDDYIFIKIPKFIEVADEYTQKRISKEKKNVGTLSGQCLENVPAELEEDKEGDKEYLVDSQEIRLSTILIQKIYERDPKFKNPNIQKWADDINKLIRIDNRAPEEIEKIINWCQIDSFWQNNILSPKSLRKNFTQLILKMNQTKDKTYQPDYL
ncbi:MAG: hypothetical protein PHX78_02770 [bacterium]|nr:hypothetical protein [bacterium]